MWFKVDDTLHSHPKARRAGLTAVGLWAMSGSYCMSYKTDGFIPEWFVRGCGAGAAAETAREDARRRPGRGVIRAAFL
mgnify:CR=1 FL=1